MSTSLEFRTPLCDLLGCRYPVVQTAMGWVAGSSLVAATTNAGGFGFLAGATIAALRGLHADHEIADLGDLADRLVSARRANGITRPRADLRSYC